MEAYRVVNFRAHRISQDTRKLTRIFILIKKIHHLSRKENIKTIIKVFSSWEEY
jgi:hypothetical protein